MTQNCPHCGKDTAAPDLSLKSQLVRMQINDVEKERVLQIPPRRRAAILLDECDEIEAFVSEQLGNHNPTYGDRIPCYYPGCASGEVCPVCGRVGAVGVAKLSQKE